MLLVETLCFWWMRQGKEDRPNSVTYLNHQPLFKCRVAICGTKGLFTPWTMKASQSLVKFVIGCWTCPGTTPVYTKDKMLERP
jgi:hypothetical protein